MSHQKYRARARRHIAIFFIALALITVFLWSLYKYQSQAGLIAVKFKLPNGDLTSELKLEVVNDEAGRKKGLMFRREMDRERGMLFVFPYESKQSFYMKNTYLPLDMLFLSASNKVVGILENVPILNESPRSVPTASQYVIELNAGSVKEYGIKVGAEAIYNSNLPKAK